MSQTSECPSRRGTRILLSILAAWATVVIVAAHTGLYRRIPPLFLAGIISLGIVLPVVAYAVSKGFRGYIESIGLRTLTAFHVWRIGAALLFFWYGDFDQLPAVFVRNAAWGDFIAGVMALGIFIFDESRRRYLVFHIVGFTDFVVAVGTGLFLFVQGDPLMAGIQVLPIALIPFFGVGISGASHLMAFDLLRRDVGMGYETES